MDNTFVVWADPGFVTGLAWYDQKHRFFNSWQYSIDDLRPQLLRLFDLADGRMALGYEDFIVTSGGACSSSPEDPLQVIQLLRDFAQERGIPLLKPQPSSARRLGQRVFLRRLGWYRPNQGHANDAAMHALAYLLKQRPIPQQIRETLYPDYA